MGNIHPSDRAQELQGEEKSVICSKCGLNQTVDYFIELEDFPKQSSSCFLYYYFSIEDFNSYSASLRSSNMNPMTLSKGTPLITAVQLLEGPQYLPYCTDCFYNENNVVMNKLATEFSSKAALISCDHIYHYNNIHPCWTYQAIPHDLRPTIHCMRCVQPISNVEFSFDISGLIGGMKTSCLYTFALNEIQCMSVTTCNDRTCAERNSTEEKVILEGTPLIYMFRVFGNLDYCSACMCLSYKQSVLYRMFKGVGEDSLILNHDNSKCYIPCSDIM